MSISSTRKVSSISSSTGKTERANFANNRSQFIENIDTNNNVLVRDDGNNSEHQKYQSPSPKTPSTDFNSATPDISTSIEALALSGIFEEEAKPTPNTHKVGVYNNNQTIIKDEEVERTGRNYLKHFYEKNEHFIDVDEFV